VLADGEEGIAARSEPLGGAVGVDACVEGTPGNEYIAAAAGICGAAAQGPPFPASVVDEETGVAAGGAAVVTCGASGSAPASEAAMALKSASFSALAGEVEGGCAALGAAGEENVSRG
jgi:hypothetical protein